jgi:septal ring factor EnvC (AmiA/AmiB activator)
MHRRLFVALIIGILLPQLLFFGVTSVSAQSEIDRLKNEINTRSNRLADIEAEIAQYESQLKQVGSEKKTLQSAINQLEIERKKLHAEITRTENLISSTDLEINKLVLEISRTQSDIDQTQAVIGSIIRAEYMAGDESLVELLLMHDRLSDFWSSYEAHENIREVMGEKVTSLSSFQKLLTEQRSENESKRKQLSSLKNQYVDQNTVLVNNKQERSKLLEVTKTRNGTTSNSSRAKKKRAIRLLRKCVISSQNCNLSSTPTLFQLRALASLTGH